MESESSIYLENRIHSHMEMAKTHRLILDLTLFYTLKELFIFHHFFLESYLNLKTFTSWFHFQFH